jgi:uncharacterized protein (TIGR03437 family)
VPPALVVIAKRSGFALAGFGNGRQQARKESNAMKVFGSFNLERYAEWKGVRLVSAFVLLAASVLAANPAFTGVVNPASNVPPGLPNYGIAEGSIFVIYGANLGPDSLVQASSIPLPTTAGLAGTSIAVTVNGTTVTAPMLYSFQSQVAAILPSTTPVGSGTLTLTYNGASGSTSITVLRTNFGISTVNETGSGPGVVTYPGYSLVTDTNSTKPGDTLVIWGTGLGPITGSDANLPAQTDLGTPIQVFVGGIQANVLYRGRSAEPGLDQINVVVPQGVTPGCNVSLVVQTGNLVSNTTSISTAANGGQCSDPNTVTQSPTLPPGKTSYKWGVFSVLSEMLYLPTTNSATLGASALFEGINGVQTAVPIVQGLTVSTASVGSCFVTAVTVSLTTQGGGSGGTTSVTGLDAGVAVSLTNPSGSILGLKPQSGVPGYYAAIPSTLPAGTYQFSTATGGADVGPFMVNLGIPSPLIWTNPNVAKSVIDRTQPLTIAWTGGDPQGYLTIDLTSLVSNTTTATESIALCTAPVNAGQFMVPPNVLLSLIPTPATGTSIVTSNLVSLLESGFQTFNVAGLDLAEGFWEYLTSVQTTFK